MPGDGVSSDRRRSHSENAESRSSTSTLILHRNPVVARKTAKFVFGWVPPRDSVSRRGAASLGSFERALYDHSGYPRHVPRDVQRFTMSLAGRRALLIVRE